jgi:tetratricopeptide (TPR) repeat protein
VVTGVEGRQNIAGAKMDEAEDLASRGLYAEALEAYLWCFDHGHLETPSFGGVRLSFLLGSIARLGASYPPALDGLRTRRDAAEIRILHDADDALSATELGRLNEKLSESGRSLDLFDRLRSRRDRGEVLRELMDFVLPELVEAKRYEHVLAVSPDPLGVVGALAEHLSSNLESIRDHVSGPECLDLTDYFKRSFVDEAAAYYEVLLGTGREEEALLCAERIIDVHPTGMSYATLIAHAVHSGAMSAARALARRGLETLPETERPVVADAAERIPTSPG